MDNLDKTENYTVRDMSLAEQGALRVDWARARMPVMAKLKEEAERTKPLAGMRVAGCLHVTKETAVLIETIGAAGAEISWSGCNPLSTQDDVAAWIASEGYSVHAWHGQSNDDFYWCIDRTLEFKPTLTLDDGADLIVRVHGDKSEYAAGVIGGTEETTTGVHHFVQWLLLASFAIQSLLSTMQSRSGTLTMFTELVNQPLTEFYVRPRFSSLEKHSLFQDTATVEVD